MPQILTSHITGLALFGLTSIAAVSTANAETKVPAAHFDLSQWNLTLPQDDNRDNKPDTITVKELQDYSHPDFFYLNEEDHLVFASPNKAITTKNSTNTRSELREMLRGTNTRYKTAGYENNWAVEARKRSEKYGRIGGKLEATLKVDHVSRNAGRPEKAAAYSAVVGQIHAIKYDDTSSGFGYGNEPIKVYYKKWPDHETGSVFWTYERNLAKDNPVRKDIAYPVFGFTWENPNDPRADGIALGEEFSYTINVHRNTMYLTFENERLGTVTYTKSLISNVDPYGHVDEDDNPYSYGGDSLYFKAGIYNQCSASTAEGFWYAACPGTGDWATDKADGNYAQATFSRIIQGPSEAPVEMVQE
ncbi:polysaccharide lyase family 7 protein [Parvularcula marina]|uniref:Polysaccharide lyase family 7 protein n=1 Tax=Parvularcula marina TaxID=2292771 RepID=A0A371REJ0_9PROT|nr:polysaccharide lyase family 7 protein [Parvularcula marina]RFB03840.1 polysaccharide lyase family 7 protein [Parvularcula marina]